LALRILVRKGFLLEAMFQATWVIKLLLTM
jgi:hypothetical protein